MKKLAHLLNFLIPAMMISMLLIGCDDDKEENLLQERGTVTDIDNNTYATIKIGNQWWMAEDLRTTHYRDGSGIQKIGVDSTEWNNDTLGSFCEIEFQQNKVGQVYNWHAVNHISGLAPAGWHVPTDEEWKELERYLGMPSNESENSGWRGNDQGDKLKVAAPDAWTLYGEVWGTNESGFSARAIGCRMFNGGFADPGYYATGFWWTSSQQPDSQAYYRHLDKKSSRVFRSLGFKSYGFSVRCIKD
jgi:uncharacterized protein (TIGR02145 family)